MGVFNDILSSFSPYTGGELDIAKLGGLGAVAYNIFGGNRGGGAAPVGYQGSIPEYTATRSRVPNTYDPNRRPGSGGQRYFTDIQYTPKVEGEAPATPMSAEGLAALNLANPARETIPAPSIDPSIMKPSNPFVDPSIIKPLATGGLAGLKKGKYLDGATDGMADKIPATIDRTQPAALSDGEFVIPADVVSHLGNGNSDAGARVLSKMMDRVRMARTGSKKQGKEIDPNKFLPA